jgi:hypothetical protein
MRVSSPTPEQIQERSAAIQAAWTPEERMSRLGRVKGPRLGIKVVSTGSLNDSITEELKGELGSWQYLNDAELRRQSRRRAAVSSSEKSQVDKPLEDDPVEEYEVVVVPFGE